ncbi:unnamed protein product [Closterium sp. NIES-53]
MIHAAAPHFLWPFAVRYAAHQLNLWPRVSLSETSLTLLWTGKVGDASRFRVWGARAFVRDTTADKLSPRAIPCVFLGFVPDAPGWQFYDPASRRVFASRDVTFDELVPFYRLFPFRSAPRPPPPLFLAPGPPQVDPLPAPGLAPSGVSQVYPPAPAPVERVEPGGAASGGAASGGAASGGAASGGAEPACTEPGGAEYGGESPEGSKTDFTRSPWSSRLRSRVPLTSQQLHDWYGRRQRRTSAPQGSTAGGSSTGVAGPGGARTGAFGAAGAGGVAAGGTGAAGGAGGSGAAAGTGAAGGAGPVEGAGATGGAGAAEGTGAAGGVGAAGGAGATGGLGAASAGGTAQPRLFFTPPSPSSQPPPDSALRQVLSLPSSTGLPLPPGSPLPAPSLYTEQTGGLAERRERASRPVSPVRSGRRVPRPSQLAVSGPPLVVRRPSSPPSRVPLPSPPASSLPIVADPVSDQFHAEHSTATRLLATIVSDPSFESTAASALVTELVAFAAHCRLDYAASLVAESASVCPPSVGGECALGTDVLEDRQEDLEYIPTPRSYAEAIAGEYSSQWQTAMDAEMASWKSTGTYVDEVPPPWVNIVSGMWIFRVKRPPGSPPVFKARYVARGFSQREGVDFFQTFSPTPKMTTLRVLLHVAAQRDYELHSLDYELHSLDFSTAFLQGSLHEEIWLRRPPGFTGSFPPGTQWSLWQPVYGLHQAPREWHNTPRTTLAALGFAPSTADPSLFLRTDTSLPPFYILVYVDDLVFANIDTEALTLITRDRARRTITLAQSHMVQQVLQRFGFTWSSAQATPLATGHSLSAPPSDESVEPSGPYPELVGCLMYLMTCTRPDLAYPLSILARYVAPVRHRPEHWEIAKRVLRYLCSTSGMGLVLGGRGDVVLTGHSDASWLTYLLTDLGERPRSPPVMYVDNKAAIALCQEHRLEHRTKHIALRYFLAQELQQRGHLRLTYVATRANTADIFTKALPPGDHQRFCTLLGLVPTLPHLLLRGDVVIHPELALHFLPGLVTLFFTSLSFYCLQSCAAELHFLLKRSGMRSMSPSVSPPQSNVSKSIEFDVAWRKLDALLYPPIRGPDHSSRHPRALFTANLVTAIDLDVDAIFVVHGSGRRRRTVRFRAGSILEPPFFNMLSEQAMGPPVAQPAMLPAGPPNRPVDDPHGSRVSRSEGPPFHAPKACPNQAPTDPRFTRVSGAHVAATLVPMSRRLAAGRGLQHQRHRHCEHQCQRQRQRHAPASVASAGASSGPPIATTLSASAPAAALFHGGRCGGEVAGLAPAATGGGGRGCGGDGSLKAAAPPPSPPPSAALPFLLLSPCLLQPPFLSSPLVLPPLRLLLHPSLLL